MVLETNSLVNLFSAQRNTDRSKNIDHILSFLLVSESLAMRSIRRVKTKIKSQTQVVHDLENLLHLQTKQTTKYGHVPALKSNYLCYHHIVQSSLWIQMNKRKNTLDLKLDKQGLACIIAQCFNGKAYTEKKL